MQCLSFVVSSDFPPYCDCAGKEMVRRICVYFHAQSWRVSAVGGTHFGNNIRTCERSQFPRYPIFWMGMFWMSWLSLSHRHVTQSWSSIHSILTSLEEAAPRPQQTSLQPHVHREYAQSSVLAGLATQGLLTHNAHSGSNTEVELFFNWFTHAEHPQLKITVCLLVLDCPSWENPNLFKQNAHTKSSNGTQNTGECPTLTTCWMLLLVIELPGLHLQFTKAERLLTPHKAFMKAVVLESPLVHILASIVAHVFEEENLPMQTPSTLGISAAMGIRDSHGYLWSQTSIDIPSKHWYPPYLDFNRHRCAHPWVFQCPWVRETRP